jgi:FkbM family methyltransferase
MGYDGLHPRRLAWWLLRRARDGWAVRLRNLPLAGSIVHTVSHRVWPSGRRAWFEIAAGSGLGLWLLLDPRYDSRLATGEVEPELQARLSQLVRPGFVVWDVGAHVGFFALTCARIVGPTGCVVAFEADEDNVDALRAAVNRNAFQNVEVCPVAVWSAPGMVEFERRKDAEGAINGAVVASGRGVLVPATSLDSELERRPAPDVVKIDVEGGEEQVLIGARRLLTEHRPIVVCEVHVSGRGNEELLPRVRALFDDAGYALEEVDPGRRQAHLLATPLSGA